jgi:hypothetical protein
MFAGLNVNWQLDEEMRSPFFVFDLIGRNASFELERYARGAIHPEFDHGKKAFGWLRRF